MKKLFILSFSFVLLLIIFSCDSYKAKAPKEASIAFLEAGKANNIEQYEKTLTKSVLKDGGWKFKYQDAIGKNFDVFLAIDKSLKMISDRFGDFTYEIINEKMEAGSDNAKISIKISRTVIDYNQSNPFTSYSYHTIYCVKEKNTWKVSQFVPWPEF